MQASRRALSLTLLRRHARAPLACAGTLTTGATSAPSSFLGAAAVSAAGVAPLAVTCRWQSTASAGAAGDETPTSAAATAMEGAAQCRRDIYELWQASLAEEEAQGLAAVAAGTELAAAREAKVRALLERHRLSPDTPREEDVSRGLGEALDRLLLLCVPLAQHTEDATACLETVLYLASRQGRQLSVRTVQHLFARAGSYAEALAVFYALRKCHVAMGIESYHAMLYSLQRLEEEGWAQRFNDEYREANKTHVSEQALDFVLRGVDNQLLPENKPWLGRVMFAATDNEAAAQQTRKTYDDLNKMWVDRYRSGDAPQPPQ